MHASVSTDPAISFHAQLINDKNQKIFSLGSEWYYYDKGQTPESQIADKVTGINEKYINLLPVKIILYDNYPNPFNPSTNISFLIPKSSFVILKVFDLIGQEVETLVDEFQNVGFHSIPFTPNSRLTSGIYYYQLKAGNLSEVKKMMMLK